jgi:hypothetical protein
MFNFRLYNPPEYPRFVYRVFVVFLFRAVVGVLDTGVSQSTCSWAPSTAQIRPRGGTTTEASGEDPHEEVPHEENNDQIC